MQIKIKGEIGWDVLAGDIERQLKFADGDIDVLVDTPGGGVYEGFSIYNALKNYAKGKIRVIVTLAASMGSYIMLAGKLPGNELLFEKNGVVMIHNPSGLAWGDYREIQSYGVLLEKLANHFRNKYAEDTGLSYEEIKDMMDSTTYFVGKDELATWGKVLEADDNNDDVLTDVDILTASAKERIQALNAKMTKEFVKADLDKVAKMFAAPITALDTKQLTKNNCITNQKQEEKMDLNELKAKYPDIYAQAKSEGYNGGVEVGCNLERKRVEDHLRFFDIAKDEAISAIKEGKTFADMMSVYTHKQICANAVQTMQKNSPTEINTDDPTKAKDENPKEAAQKTEIENSLKARGLMEVK